MIIIILTVVISFLCGSIPTGYLIMKKIYGIDIRTKGSKNIGSTNVKRIAGTKISMITQTIDILKGVLPVILAMQLYEIIKVPLALDVYVSIVAISAILGHNYTPFLKFNGGKGVNTTLGVFIIIAPIPALAGLTVYLVLRVFTSTVSIRSLVAGITIPIMCVFLKLQIPIIISATIASILMIVRHKQNIIRIIHNKEN